MSERRVLVVSVWATSLFALLGIVWGILANSGMILFDGIYSLLSLGLSYLSLLVLQQVECRRDDDRFPFGKASFEPLLIIFKSLVIAGMCVFSAVNSFSDLLMGGREVSPGTGALFALVSTLGCYFVRRFIYQKNKRLNSALLEVECNQWFGDFLLSFGVLIGFSLAFFLQDGPLAWLVPFVDPGMVLLASSLFIIIPLRSFFSVFKEVLFFQVDDVLRAPIDSEAKQIAAELGAGYKLRMVSIGREVNIELNFLVGNQSFSVVDMDIIRNRIAAVVLKMEKHYWVNINFTQEPEWL